jgi:hypothetical protein
MFAIRLVTLTAMLLLAACGTAGSGGAGQPGARAETRPIGWDMLDATTDPAAWQGTAESGSSWDACDVNGCLTP